MQNIFLAFLALGLAYSGTSKASDTAMQPSKNSENWSKDMQMKAENHLPQYLYKIVSPEAWQASLLKNQLVTSALDKDFIHLSTEKQLAHVAQKFWSGKNYIILKLDVKQIVGRLVYETNPGGTTPYYHLYGGSIPLEAVADIATVNQ